MPTKSKLEQAVEAQADSLNKAQREIVLAQFSDYKRNKARMAQIEDVLSAPEASQVTSSMAQGAARRRIALVGEHAQLAKINGEISAWLFEQLSEDRG